MNTQTKRRNCSGMTLVEVVIMSGLVTIVLMGVIAATFFGDRLNQANSQRLTSFGLCKEWYEQMKGGTFTNVTTTSFAPQSIRLTHLGGINRMPIYGQRSCVITDIPSPRSKKVAIQVQWTYRGQDFTESLEGLIYDRP